MTINPITPNAPLSNPSHANQHLTLNGQMANLTSRVAGLEQADLDTVAALQQARRTAHEWVVRGPLFFDNNLLLPILWNLTAQTVQYEAAMMTVYTAPTGSSLKVDLVAGDVLASGQYDSNNMDSVLVVPLEIMAGTNTSQFYTSNDFTTDMASQTFLAAYITQVGSSSPGADLTIQLNRLL